MIKAIAWDLDGMLFHEPHYFTKELALRYDIPEVETIYVKDPKWRLVNEGKISLNEFLKPYIERWSRHPKFNLTLEEFKQAWFSFAKVDAEMFVLAKQLKEKGVKNIIATNNPRERIDFLNENYNLKEIFTVIGSFDLGVMKPSEEYYKAMMEKLKLNPEEVLYYDDKESTVNDLIKFGFKARVYKNIKEFKEEIKNLLH